MAMTSKSLISGHYRLISARYAAAPGGGGLRPARQPGIAAAHPGLS